MQLSNKPTFMLLQPPVFKRRVTQEQNKVLWCKSYTNTADLISQAEINKWKTKEIDNNIDLDRDEEL